MKRLGRRLAGLAGLAGLAAIAGCATPIQPPIVGYTCCNLHPSDGWLSIDNYQGGPFIALGQKVTFDSIKRGYYVYGAIGNQEYGLNNDYARTHDDTLKWARRLVVAENPLDRLAGFSPEVRTAIRQARIIPGMTRDQVAMAIGYPSPAETPALEAPVWRYLTLEDAPVAVLFDPAGTVLGLSGAPGAMAVIDGTPWMDKQIADQVSSVR